MTDWLIQFFNGADKLMHFLTGGLISSLSAFVICALFGSIEWWSIIAAIFITAIFAVLKEYIDSSCMKNKEYYSREDIIATMKGSAVASLIMLISIII